MTYEGGPQSSGEVTYLGERLVIIIIFKSTYFLMNGKTMLNTTVLLCISLIEFLNMSDN